MNQRRLEPGEKAIPAVVQAASVSELAHSAEAIAFDKAEQAEKVENAKQRLVREITELEAGLKQAVDENEKQEKQKALEQKRQHLKAVEHAGQAPQAKDS
ncbi:MAG: hypothetical protein SWC96_09915, partial [Thermodesulfobacteriota bacterium]|nr:hypothetical protein [Thermodesulfobacteriota bacterium]